VKDIILVSHDFKIRLETDRKLEKEERGRGETGRERGPAEQRPSFPFVENRRKRENALLREKYSNGNFSKETRKTTRT